MTRFHLVAYCALCALVLSECPAQAGTKHLVGGGVQYLKTVGDVKENEDFDENALSIVGSYQYWSSPRVALELDVEAVRDFGGSDEILWQPQGYLLLGSRVYGAAGIGIGYFDGEWLDDPFYALRLGFDIPIGRFHLDVNANYRFQELSTFRELYDTDLDTITFGAFIRVEL